MSVGAFAGIVTTTCLADAIPLAPLRLAVAMVVAGLFAAIAGVIVGVPVLRLKGDYLAIVTLAFGEIIKNLVNVMYLGLDDAGLHFSLVNQNFQLGDGGKMIINGRSAYPASPSSPPSPRALCSSSLRCSSC